MNIKINTEYEQMRCGNKIINFILESFNEALNSFSLRFFFIIFKTHLILFISSVFNPANSLKQK